MLRNILQSAGLNAKVCADLLGLDHKLFHEWLNHTRPIPGYIIPELSSVLGVPQEAITAAESSSGSVDDAPAIWFRFREGDRLTDADRELVVVIRKLAHYMDEVEELGGSRGVAWEPVFEGARRVVSRQASPVEQGIAAARFVREVRQFGFCVYTQDGIKGTGDTLRGNLRSIGIRIVETPLPTSNLEGCSFFVGSPGSEKPCLFANTYKQTWFRRNAVLMHELAHAIFDIETSAASLDFDGHNDRSFEEVRADAFAQEVLAPKSLLHHIARTQGLNWNHLTSKELALLVASVQAELRMVLAAALSAEFITIEQANEYQATDIHSELMALTERALSTDQFVESRRLYVGSIIPPENRTTTVPARAIRLPLPYVTQVLELARQSDVSYRKAAQLLMIEQDIFIARFGKLLEGSVA